MRKIILHTIILILLSASTLFAEGPPQYRYIQITHYDTTVIFSGTNAYLNNQNQVIFRGASIFRNGGYTLLSDKFPTTIWTEGHLDTLPHSTGDQSSTGWDRLNNNGQTVGSVWMDALGKHVHPFSGSLSGLIELGILPKTHPPDTTFGPCVWGRGTDINDNGQIVGVVSEGDNFFLNKHAYPVIWDGGTPTKIPHPDNLTDEETDYVFPLYINNAGQISGTMTKNDTKSFFGNSSSISFIPHGDSSIQMSEVNNMSETGFVVGLIRGNLVNPFTNIAVSNQRHAYVSELGGTMFDLNDLDSATWQGWTNALDVNSDGHIVGTTSGGNALLWWRENGTWTLHSLYNLITEGNNIPNSISSALSINDNGVILGYSTLAGSPTPFLLIPINTTDNFCVNTASDAPDINPGDGICSTGELNVFGEPYCSMRAAIQESNAFAGKDTICFNIPSNDVIYPQTALPTVTDSVFINGQTQPTNGIVHINGQQQGTGNGLEISSGHSTIRGLMLNQFASSGLVLKDNDSNIVESCWFGTDSSESTNLANGTYGIYIENSNGNKIGQPGALEKANRIARNADAGIFIQSGEQNTIFTNYIYLNDGLGIDLAPSGVNQNDVDDIDTGPNTRLNHPVIKTVENGNLYGSYDGEPNETVIVELYRSDSADASGYGEGQEPLALTTTVNTDANGLGSFILDLSGETLTDNQVFTLLAHDNDNSSEFSPAWPLKSLKIVDINKSALSNQSFLLFQVNNDPPDFTETFIDTITTDSLGFVDLRDYLLQGTLSIDDMFKVERLLHVEDTKKHPTLLATAYSVFIDNIKFDSLGLIEFGILNDTTLQEVILDHTTIKFNLVVSIEWDADLAYLQSTETAFRNMSNYLYDVSDGQMCFDTIVIYDDKENWDFCDFRINTDNTVHPHVKNIGGFYRPGLVGSDPVEMPRKWYGGSDKSRNQSANENPLDMTSSVDYRTRVHEFGHFALNFKDEYKLFVDTNVRCSEHKPFSGPNGAGYGYMDYHYDGAGVYTSELSRKSAYNNPLCQNNLQWNLYNKSCWEVADDIWAQTYDGILAPIIQPDERQLATGFDYLQGPNDNLSSIDYDVGSKMTFPITPAVPTATTFRAIFTTEEGSTIVKPKMNILLVDSTGTLPEDELYQGRTSDSGKIWVLGFLEGKHFMSYAGFYRKIPAGTQSLSTSEQKVWVYGEGGSPGLVGESRFGNKYYSSSIADSVIINLSEVKGDYPLIMSVELNGTDATLTLDSKNLFGATPNVDHKIHGDTIVNYNFNVLANGYEATINDSINSFGQFKIWAIDDSSSSFFINTSYNTQFFDSLIQKHIVTQDGASEIDLDTSNNSIEKAVILSSPYPVLMNGLNPLSLQAGETHCFATYPNSVLSGNNQITIRYDDSELKGWTNAFDGEFTLQIYYWNSSSKEWELVGGQVDTLFNEVSAPITKQGVYAAFTTDYATDIKDDLGKSEELPTKFTLSQNYPNPFNPETVINYSLPTRSHVAITVFNLLGQRVKTLFDATQIAGSHSVSWDGTDNNGNSVASGIYLYRFQANDFIGTKKMLLLK